MSHKLTTETIIHIFRTHGHIDYGEGCSVLSHSMQAGYIAKEKGYDKELILAAFLHDIGHLSPLEEAEAKVGRMGKFGIEAHEKLGEAFLEEQGFSERIITTVKNHVASKRYLCYAEADYYAQLSNASKETLNYQGGPMQEAEAKAFESAPFFEDSIRIRRIDEEAKAQDFEITAQDWYYFTDLLEEFTSN